MRRVVSGILSGPSDLSVDVQPLSPFDLKRTELLTAVVLTYSLIASPTRHIHLLLDFGLHLYRDLLAATY